MSAPTSIQLWMLSSVEKMEEYIALKMAIPKAFIKSYWVAPDVLQMIKDDSYVTVIADHVFTKLNAAKHDRATAADIEIEGDNVYSSAPLKPLGDHLNFRGLQLGVIAPGMTLEGALNNVRFHYQIPDDDAPAAAAAAAAASKTPGAAGSSSSAIDLRSDEEDEAHVPPPNPNKRKATIEVAHVVVKVFKNEFEKALNMIKLDDLRPVARRLHLDQNQNKPEVVADISEEICQFAVNKLNNGIF